MAIAVILAAAAIPHLRRFQLPSKNAEIKMSLNGMRTAEMAHTAASERSCGRRPRHRAMS